MAKLRKTFPNGEHLKFFCLEQVDLQWLEPSTDPEMSAPCLVHFSELAALKMHGGVVTLDLAFMVGLRGLVHLTLDAVVRPCCDILGLLTGLWALTLSGVLADGAQFEFLPGLTCLTQLQMTCMNGMVEMANPAPEDMATPLEPLLAPKDLQSLWLNGWIIDEEVMGLMTLTGLTDLDLKETEISYNIFIHVWAMFALAALNT